MYINMEQIGNCGKTSMFLPKEKLSSHRLSPMIWLSVDDANLLRTGPSSFSSSQKQKTGWDLSGNQAQFSPTRGNPVLSSLL